MDVYHSTEEASEAKKRLGMDFEYTQITQGQYRHSFSTAQHDDLVFALETASTNITGIGKTSSAAFLLLSSDHNTGCEMIVNGRPLKSNELVVCPPRSELNVYTAGEVIARQIIVPRVLVRSSVRNLGNREFKLENAGLVRMNFNDKKIRKIYSSIDDICNNQESCGDLVPEISSVLMGSLADINGTLLSGLYRQKGRPPADHNKIYKKAIDYISNHLKSSIKLEQLCLHTGVDLKTLERIFIKHASVSPKTYIQVSKLNAVKRDLLQASHHETTVSMIAYEYEFNHLGRFSASYFRLFGEYPKQTLKR